MYDKWFGKDPIFQMKVGTTFKYKKTIWEVIEIHEYNWNRDGKSLEYKVRGDSQEAFLEVEDDDGDILCMFSYEIQKHQILPDFTNEDFEGDDILAEVEYMGNRYKLDEISEGYYSNTSQMGSSLNVTTYTFYHKDDFICIAQWEDGSMEFSDGTEVKRKKIKNIELPVSGNKNLFL